MSLDPKAQAFLEQMAAQMASLDPPPPSIDQLPPSAIRELYDGFLLTWDSPPAPVGRVEDRHIAGPGGSIRIRIYTPDGPGPFPALVYFHSGCFIFGSIETHDVPCRALANAADCVVVSVDYRLAPEHRFPAAPEDCYAATRWVAENACAIGVDPTHVAVGGDSAGGNLAAVVALMARDRGGPRLAYQLLIYPNTGDTFDTASHHQFADGYLLTRELMAHARAQYLNDPAEAQDPYVSPLRANDLRGLPPALVVTAGYDPLHDEGQAYAARLQNAGVPTEVVHFESMPHVFFSMGAVFEQAHVARDEIARRLRAALGSPKTTSVRQKATAAS